MADQQGVIHVQELMICIESDILLGFCSLPCMTVNKCYCCDLDMSYFVIKLFKPLIFELVVVVVVNPTPPTCCQQSPAPESCGSQQSLPPGGKERLHFVGIRPEVQARKGGW